MSEIGFAAGLHNSLRISYFSSKTSGTTTAPNDLVIFSQPYVKGDQLTTNAKLTDVKISYEYLTWPYPVGGPPFPPEDPVAGSVRHDENGLRRPIKSATPDAAEITRYSAVGSKSYFTPAFGSASTNTPLAISASKPTFPASGFPIASISWIAMQLRLPRLGNFEDCGAGPRLLSSAPRPKRITSTAAHGRRLRRHPLVLGLRLVGQDGILRASWQLALPAC